MNSKGDGQLKTLKELAIKNNLTISFLNQQIKLGRLDFEKKGKILYSSQTWIEQYQKDFTFYGFMMDRVFPKQSQKRTPAINKKIATKNVKKKELGKIVKEEKVNIDIEEALVGKWNKEFRKINNDFNDFLNSSNKKNTKKNISKDKKINKSEINPHNIHSAVMAVAIMFLISFYTVSLAPNVAESFTKKMDTIVNAPYNFINQLAINNIIKKDDVEIKYGIPSSEQLSKYIKNHLSKISYPAGASVNVPQKDIAGKVAGIDEEYIPDHQNIFDKIKKATIDTFTKLSDKQKSLSLKLNDKLTDIISSIND